MGLFRKKKAKQATQDQSEQNGELLQADRLEDSSDSIGDSELAAGKESSDEKKSKGSFLAGMVRLDKKKVNLNNLKECQDYVTEQCEQIAAVKQQLLETKVEYGAVTSYLTDIQKIDGAPEKARKEITEAARRIVNLGQERTRYQNREVKISEIAYKTIEKYEDKVPEEIDKMKKNEQYELLVKEDMRQLEGEKAVLKYQKDQFFEKRRYIRSIEMVTMALLIVVFVMLSFIQAYMEVDVKIPFLATILVGAVGILLLYLENNKNNEAISLNERKINKAIGLMNSVKIKYVNNRNNLDYTYQKYRVHASQELEYLWNQYVKAKEERRRYQQNTEMMETYSNVLVDLLDHLGLMDSEVWIYQPAALVDDKEMVEVRHRLNSRRQKLREQIDYNNGIITDAKNELRKMDKQKPELSYEIQKRLVHYDIDLDLSAETPDPDLPELDDILGEAELSELSKVSEVTETHEENVL